jgi:hypothetical protein
MTADQLADIAARIERARREVTALSEIAYSAEYRAAVKGAAPLALMHLDNLGFCVPRLRGAEDAARAAARAARK